MIKIKDAKKVFKDAVIFNHLNFEIHEPGLYIIQGESGSGKSTFLNILAGFESFDNGEISVNNNLSTIFQNYELINELTVQENILLTKKEFNKEELILLEKLGIKEILNYYPNECSGGQQQRVGIARSLLLDPNIILCDEPTESLDIANKHIVMQLLKELSKQKVVIVATHDQKMIDEYADCCFKIEDKNIVKENDYHSCDSIVDYPMQKATPKEISYFVNKILHKKTLVASLFLVLLLVIVQGLFIFEKKMFYVAETLNAVNVNQLYVDVNSDTFDFSKLDINKENLTPILKFRNIVVDSQSINCKIYPYVDNDLELNGEKPQGNTIIINQNVAEKIDGAIGKEISMNYFISSLSKSMNFKISGIINEKDSNSLSVYYDLNYVNQEMNTLKMLDGNTQLQYIQKFGTYYVYPTSYESLAHYYQKASEVKNVFLSNTLYDERVEFREMMLVYQLLFTIFEVLILIGIIIFMTIYIIRDTNHYLSICSILVSMQMPLKEIRKSYLKTKIKYFVPLIFLSGIVFYIIYELTGIKQFMNMNDLYSIYVCLMFFVVWYLMLLRIEIRKLQQSKISFILKNSKD